MKQTLSALFLCLFAIHASGQQLISGPEPRGASIIGVVTDTDGSIVPNAMVTADGSAEKDRRAGTTTGDGSFVLEGLAPAVPYQIHVHAKGFLDWTSATITLKPGERFDLQEIKLAIGVVETTVSAVSAEELAVEQIKNEEKQRVFGIIPNFYVSYDPRFVPLSTKLKFQLALHGATDAASIGGSALIAGINQASASAPGYRQGITGYGKRFGAAYTGAVTTVFFGGAILPTAFHQDPRYFYQGTGTRKSRAFHAMSAPIRARSDRDGHWMFNYSSIGGDLISAAISNVYYPPKDRGAGVVFGGAGIAMGGRVVNALAQEFLLRKLTTNSKDHD